MTTPARSPLPRIGDAERDDAVSLLQEHMAAGRLDQSEFTDRMNSALTARTQADLDPLFMDLPGRRPGQQVASAPASGGADPSRPTAQPPRHRSASTSRTLAWAVLGLVALGLVLALSLTGHFEHWWLFVMLPIFLSFGGHRRRGGCGRRR